MKTVNVNDYVSFMLTERGVEVYINHVDRVNSILPDKVKIKLPDELGTGVMFRMQLWCFMNAFGGRSMRMGIDGPVCENALHFDFDGDYVELRS